MKSVKKAKKVVERQQNWPKSLPSDATPQPPYDSRRGGDGQ